MSNKGQTKARQRPDKGQTNVRQRPVCSPTSPAQYLDIAPLLKLTQQQQSRLQHVLQTARAQTRAGFKDKKNVKNLKILFSA